MSRYESVHSGIREGNAAIIRTNGVMLERSATHVDQLAVVQFLFRIGAAFLSEPVGNRVQTGLGSGLYAAV